MLFEFEPSALGRAVRARFTTRLLLQRVDRLARLLRRLLGVHSAIDVLGHRDFNIGDLEILRRQRPRRSIVQLLEDPVRTLAVGL